MTLFFHSSSATATSVTSSNPRPTAPVRPSVTTSTTTSGAPQWRRAAVNGMAADHVDRGLLDNPARSMTPRRRAAGSCADAAQRRRHRSLHAQRRVPNLRTVVLFYNKYNSKSAKRQVNPDR